jgi:hypothetical protein
MEFQGFMVDLEHSKERSPERTARNTAKTAHFNRSANELPVANFFTNR